MTTPSRLQRSVASVRFRVFVASVAAATMATISPAGTQEAPAGGSGAPDVQSTAALGEGLASPALLALEQLTDGRTAAGVIGGPSDALLLVPVTSDRYTEAVVVRDSIVAEIGDAQTRYADSGAQLETLALDRIALDALLPRSILRAAKVQEVDADAREGASAMAVAMYVGDTESRLLPNDDVSVEQRLDQAQATQIAATASARLTEHARLSRQRVEDTALRLAELQGASDDTDVAIGDQTTRREQAVVDYFDAAERAAVAEVEVRAARASADVSGTDLTLVALDAYWRATERLRVEDPTCGLQWWALAGVGRTESNHGRFGGRTVAIDGQVDSPVIGIPLDGTNATRLIPDSDGGRLDGDSLFDRAVGPMQFIPGTWARWGEDLSGNEVADPQNFYDATLAAARYLCAYGPGLGADDALRRAYFGYNRSESYVELVLSRAHEYRDAALPISPPADLPTGQIPAQ